MRTISTEDHKRLLEAEKRLAFLEANCAMIQLKRAAGAAHSEGWSRQFNPSTLCEWIDKEMRT